MIAWRQVADRLAALARSSPADGLLSVTLVLPQPPAAAIPVGRPWFHWQRPDAGLRLTGVGDALKLESQGPGRFVALGAGMSGLRAAWRYEGDGPAPLAFAGFGFAPVGGAPLPNASLVVPALLLREEEGSYCVTFSCATTAAANAPQYWRRLWESLAAPPPLVAPQALSRVPAPLADQAFLARGRAALAAINDSELQKLVLTRSVRFQSEREIAPWPVLDALAAANPGCAVWAVSRGDGVFLGASPELLLAVRGQAVAADALAGTAWRGGAAGRNAASLPLCSDKNRREHDLVPDAVAAALAPLCHDVVVPAAPEILCVQEIQHLRRRITGCRRADVGVFDLLASLHPTPAVGGFPAAVALDWLAQHGDQRGAWYTGGIGWVAADGDADFAVALRCGLLAGRDITLYAGAGFVRGSDPQQEFAETEAKLSPMLTALRQHAKQGAVGPRMTGT